MSRRTFTSETLYNDFKWHTVRIERNSSAYQLVVDGKLKAVQKTSSPSLSSHLQLGGFPTRRVKDQSSITENKALALYIRPTDWR